MVLFNIINCVISILLLTPCISSVRITGDHFTFGGVNDQSLQFLEPSTRNDVIRSIVRSNARVVRLMIRGDEMHFDPEKSLGEFDNSILDQFDDALAAIHRISNGKLKVIIAPHDAHSLRGSNGAACDAYCKKIGGAFLDFYSDLENREIYKNRLTALFKNYKSKNFKGASWNTLKQVILGVDVQNEPWSGIWPIVAGEAWLCDIATHLKEGIGLGANGIAVISGGISGANSPGGIENFPDSAFDCPALDVLAIHGYYSASEESTAGTTWANMFLPGNTLTGRALGSKLLMVEELSYKKSKLGLHYKNADVWDQGNALNYRGIPFLYSRITTGDEGSSGDINIFRNEYFAIGALSDVLKKASTSCSNFDWSRYIAPPKALSNSRSIALNPYIPEQSSCTFGCLGHLCDSPDSCVPGYVCKNNICQVCVLGCAENECDNHRNLCQESMKCIDSTCQTCTARVSRLQQRVGIPREQFEKPRTNDPNGQCELDDPFRREPICNYCNPLTHFCRGSPCEKPTDCDADEFCDWGLCKTCTSDMKGCLGMKCRSNKACKTGHCNSFGRCDYPPPKPKGPVKIDPWQGRRGPGYNVPRGHERGPAKVRNEAMRVNIPQDGVMETGKAKATGA